MLSAQAHSLRKFPQNKASLFMGVIISLLLFSQHLSPENQITGLGRAGVTDGNASDVPFQMPQIPPFALFQPSGHMEAGDGEVSTTFITSGYPVIQLP